MRAIFNLLVWKKLDMSINEFILKLQQQAMKCNFGNQLTIYLRDRLVEGINDENI